MALDQASGIDRCVIAAPEAAEETLPDAVPGRGWRLYEAPARMEVNPFLLERLQVNAPTYTFRQAEGRALRQGRQPAIVFHDVEWPVQNFAAAYDTLGRHAALGLTPDPLAEGRQRATE